MTPIKIYFKNYKRPKKYTRSKNLIYKNTRKTNIYTVNKILFLNILNTEDFDIYKGWWEGFFNSIDGVHVKHIA